MYSPQNKELKYKELLDVCDDLVFKLSKEQISETKGTLEPSIDQISRTSKRLDESWHPK